MDAGGCGDRARRGRAAGDGGGRAGGGRAVLPPPGVDGETVRVRGGVAGGRPGGAGPRRVRAGQGLCGRANLPGREALRDRGGDLRGAADADRARGAEVKTTVIGSYPKIPDPPAPGRWRAGVEKLQRGEITREDLRRVEDEVTVAALNRELKALAQAGASVIQVDEPGLLAHRDHFPLFRRAMDVLWDGVDAQRALYTYFGHIDGLYPALLDVPVDVLGLDFVAGARNWDVLRKAKFTKQLGLGIVDARNTKMETPAAVADACRRATAFVPPSHLHVGPSAGLEFLPRGVAQRKLEVLAAGVRRFREGGA